VIGRGGRALVVHPALTRETDASGPSATRAEARMNNHKNALTTPYSRLLMARRVDARRRSRQSRLWFCVSEQTVRNGFDAGE